MISSLCATHDAARRTGTSTLRRLHGTEGDRGDVAGVHVLRTKHAGPMVTWRHAASPMAHLPPRNGASRKGVHVASRAKA
jgi:hypothetical protein